MLREEQSSSVRACQAFIEKGDRREHFESLDERRRGRRKKPEVYPRLAEVDSTELAEVDSTELAEIDSTELAEG
jgi:hypothetical protein